MDGGSPAELVAWLRSQGAAVRELARNRRERLEGTLTDGTVSVRGAALLFASLRALHHAGIAHRDLRPENLFMSEKEAGFRSLDAAVAAASELARRLDLAQALATLAQAVGLPAPSRHCGMGTGPSTTGLSRPSCNRSPWRRGDGGRCAPPRPA